ncbi:MULTISPECIES: hypothetical protein [Aeromonas]|uniref:hypothetical protein n=1 Tax=Aeromonas TaxID=642 RepID=UPI002B47378D|nr:hypothetical protein [Aeromonas veronii]
MTEEEARKLSIKTTDYCYVLACAWEKEVNNSICLERIFVKSGQEEIRLAWWKDGKQTMRPADLNAVDWVPLFTSALKQGVFNSEEQLGMLKALISN